MKKTFFILALSLVSLGMFAQETREFRHLVGISPFQLGSGIRVKYETPLNNRFTVGGVLTYYYGSFPGIHLAPQARLFFRSNAPDGFYAQFRAVAGYHFETEISTTFGAGLALGYQVFFGRSNRIFLDFNIGARFMTPVVEDMSGFEDTTWFLWGPGSLIDGLFSIGYRF
jgi:hypothetical protein